MASEITLQPVRRHGVDAAIFFSDIVIPLKVAGVEVEIQSGVGPVMGAPVRNAAEVAALPTPADASFHAVSEGIALTVEGLAEISRGTETLPARAEGAGLPLIGFAGAPFTLASYLIEGRPSRDHLVTRAMMHGDPETWHRLLDWTAHLSGAFLRAQVLAGASAVQLFDSWAGALSRADYLEYVAPHSRTALSYVADLGVPRSHFGVATGELLTAMRDVGADVLGIDHRIGLAEANERVGGATPLQGNIDPALLLAPWPVLEAHVRDVVEQGRNAPAHIVNLGHGVPPIADPEVLTRVVELVHSL